MPDTPQITFGDNVKVRGTPETEANGLAGLVGQVYGATTPSVTGVEVIGDLARDRAVAVHFHGRGETLWFAEELLEFVDHAPGTTVGAAGGNKSLVRSETGEWIEIQEKKTCETPEKKTWWRFWR